MDVKETIQNAFRYSGKKQADSRLIYLLGLVGLLLLASSAWLYFSDYSTARKAENAAAQGNAAVSQLRVVVESVQQALGDPETQALARRVIETPEAAGDLLAHLQARAARVESATVYSLQQSRHLVPAEIGANGFAVMDMVLSTLEGKRSLMQIHQVLQPPRLFDSIAVKEGEEIVGALIVEMDPAFVLDAFVPDYSALGLIRLSQYNGRQPVSILREFGNAALAGDVPERILVPGTIFRIEYPQVGNISVAGGRTLILFVVVGLVCVVVATVLHRNFRRKDTGESREVAAPVMEAVPAAGDEPSVEEPDADFTELPPSPAPVPEEDEPRPRREPPAAPAGPAEAPAAPMMNLHYDIAERRRQREAEHAPVELSPEIFRAYDIRGVIDKTLDSGIARGIGRAVGSLVTERQAGPLVVARDGRLSGPYLMEGVIEGALAAGCDVLDIGAVPTGVAYYAAHEFAAGSSVVITGSHNPPDYNGFKVMVSGDTLHGDAITALYQRIVDDDLASGEGQLTQRDVIPDYIDRIAGDVTVEKPLKVVIDCGNGIGGICAADTLRALGVDVLPLYDEVDGTFPNHHPDPSEPENLADLIDSVRLMDADLGLALDGDADRLGVVTMGGRIIYPDLVMILLALDVLDRVPGATILYDVKCTGHLPTVIRNAGGKPVMYKTGHSLMKSKMKEIGAPFAGEMSGHFFFGERWYGVDDGIYAAARLLEILGGTETPPEAILNALPKTFSTPELKVHMQEGETHAFIEKFKQAVTQQVHIAAHFEDAEINTIDGLRADFDDGWGLVRASNTTPVLVVRFDAETEQALERIKSLFRRQMLELDPNLELPF